MISLLEPGDPTAPVGSKPWCLALYYEGCALKKEDTFIVKRLKFTLIALRSEGYFERLTDKDGRPFLMWEDFVQTPEPFGLGMRVEIAEAIMREKDETKLLGTLKEEVKHQDRAAALAGPDGVPLPKPTGRPNLDDEKVANNYLLPKGSTSAARITARIKRDRPDVAVRQAAGEFPSVQAAAREAGIVRKSPDGLGKPETLAKRILARGPDYAEAVMAALQEGRPRP